MFESHLVTSVNRTSFDFRFEEFFQEKLAIFLCKHSSTVLLTNHRYSISKICPKFQVISSHFFKVDELLDEQ